MSESSCRRLPANDKTMNLSRARIGLRAAAVSLLVLGIGVAGAEAGSGGIGDDSGSGAGTATASGVETVNPQLATWYGPGLFGNKTACGQTLKRKTLGVAHRTLPCGTKVEIHYKGDVVRTKVIDRGPYANDAKWDLTQKTARLLGFTGVDEIQVAKLASSG